MSNKMAKGLIIGSAIFLILVGLGLYNMFERQGFGDKKVSNYVNYNVNDYIQVTPIIFNNYDNIYSDINVSRVDIINIDSNITKSFIDDEREIINYISGYYNDIKPSVDYVPINTANSIIKTQINGAILSVFYEMDFNFDNNLFDDNVKKYFVTTNIDLGTERALTTEDLLSKYDYTKDYIAEKIFEEDILIDNGQIVIDKNTNISLTKNDIIRKKNDYINRIVNEFDNIIKVYIENNYLTLVYDKKELNSMFFDNAFDTDIKTRYLK